MPSCAPHYGGATAGHVNDPTDVMHWQETYNPRSIDPHHTEYFATGSTTCGDVTRWGYFTPN